VVLITSGSLSVNERRRYDPGGIVLSKAGLTRDTLHGAIRDALGGSQAAQAHR
jgi:hypothetical protein